MQKNIITGLILVVIGLLAYPQVKAAIWMNNYVTAKQAEEDRVQVYWKKRHECDDKFGAATMSNLDEYRAYGCD